MRLFVIVHAGANMRLYRLVYIRAFSEYLSIDVNKPIKHLMIYNVHLYRVRVRILIHLSYVKYIIT